MATEALTVIVIVWSIWKLKKIYLTISLLTPSLSHVTLGDTTSNHLSSRSVTNYLNGPLNLKKTSVDLWMQKCHLQECHKLFERPLKSKKNFCRPLNAKMPPSKTYIVHQRFGSLSTYRILSTSSFFGFFFGENWWTTLNQFSEFTKGPSINDVCS